MEKYIWLIIGIGLISLIIYGLSFIFRLLIKKLQPNNEAYKLVFELKNGINLSFHPLSFSAHKIILEQFTNRITQIRLLKRGQQIRQYKSSDYIQAQKEVKRLAKFM